MIHKPYFSKDYYQRSIDALNTGLKTAPAYASWKELDPGDNVPVDDRYAALPALTKEEIREHFPHGLVPNHLNHEDGLDAGEIEYVQTSGTTSEKVTNIWNQSWWNAAEAASWKLNSHTAHLDHSVREAQLASALSVGFRSDDDLPMQSRILNGRFLFLNEKVSAREWTALHYERMIRELNEFKPAILEANPSLLARLAWWAIENNSDVYLPQVVLFTYEFVSAIHLRSIRQVFSVPLISSYGCTEAGYIFMQCEYGTYHQNTDFCRVDFQPLKTMHGGPALGRILVTTFHNTWVSLIRFDAGDLVRLDERSSCTCGRNEGYMLSAIEGRVANATFTTKGRLITTKRLDDALAAIENIRDYQFEQSSRSEYVLKLAAAGDRHRTTERSKEILHSLYGNDANVTVGFHNDIEPAASGKYRRTHADIDFNEKEIFV